MDDGTQDDHGARPRAARFAGPSAAAPAAAAAPSDRPPVGEPLVASRRAGPREHRGGPGTAGSANGSSGAGADRVGGPPVPAPEPPPAPPFTGRAVLVTGAASELGAAFADAFAGVGAELHLLDGDLPALQEVAAGLPGGARALVLRCDLGSVDEIRSVGDFLEQAEARPDVVVHAAQVAAPGSALGSPIEDLDEHYLIGVRGPTVLLQSIVPRLAPGATVVFADRLDGTAPGDAHRAVADAARAQLVDVLREELVACGVSVMSARAVDGTPAGDVAARVVGALVADRPTEVVEVLVGPRPAAPPGR